MGRKRRKQSGLLADALNGRWSVAATIAVVALVLAHAIIPVILGHNPFTAPLAAVFAQISNLVALVFAVIAVVKYLAETKVNTSQPSFERREPTSHPPPAKPAQPPRTPTLTTPSPNSTDWSKTLLQSIEWKRFEDLCAAYYQSKGIRSATTALGPDGGVDIRLYQDDSGHATTIVQCKAWPEQKVGVKLIRELLGVRVAEKANKAFFMTCGGYTKDALDFAQANGITLFTGDMLLMMLQRAPAAESQRLLALATEGDYTTPTCPSCGQKLVARESARGRFWGCRSYPYCHGKLGMRGG